MGTWQFPELTECSGLAYSKKWAMTAYCHNDEAGSLFVVDLSTGKKIGSIGIKGVTLVDPEDIDITPDGVLYWADIGDNDENRSSVNVYYLREPGPGNHGNVTWSRINLQYPGGARNAETFVCWPNGDKDIVDKRPSGSAFRFPKTLSGGTNTLKLIKGPTTNLAELSGGVAQKDGRWAFATRKDELDNIAVYDSKWNLVDEIPMPSMVKPEAIGVQQHGDKLWVADDKGGTGGKFQLVKIPKAYLPNPKPYTPPPANTPPANPCMA